MPHIPRLYLNVNLALHATIALNREQSHYLLHVLRCSIGDVVCVFDGRVEASARIFDTLQNTASIKIEEITRRKSTVENFKLTLAFAPTKGLGASYVVQKATELGVDEIIPLLTKHAVVKSVNAEKLDRVAIEAAEQCERLDVPVIRPMMPLAELLHQLQGEEAPQIMFCYERATPGAIALKPHNTVILIGPEGGWSEQECKSVMNLPGVLAASINHNILKAETATVCAVALASYLLQYKV